MKSSVSSDACSIALALDPLVEVEDVDVLRAAEIRGPRDLARQRLLPDEARDGDVLALLDVRAEDGELGEALEPALAPALGRFLGRGHARTLPPTQCPGAAERLPRPGRSRVEAAGRRADRATGASS